MRRGVRKRNIALAIGFVTGLIYGRLNSVTRIYADGSPAGIIASF